MTHKTATIVNPYATAVSLREAADLICACPEVRFHLEGEPGIGKSSIMAMLKERLGTADYHFTYVDASNLDLGDVGVPVPDYDARVVRFFQSVRFGLHTDKVPVIMIDEFTKAMQSVQNMLHPLLEAHNPRLGDTPLPAGAIVFTTGNLSANNVGDNMKAHTRNRLTPLTVRKPTAEEWLEDWAAYNDVSPVLMACVKRNPQWFASYTDYTNDNDNPFVYNPRRPQAAFVSGRSLERASTLIKRRAQFSESALRVALTGTVGAGAANDLLAFVQYQDQLPAFEAICRSPTTAVVPTDPGACMVIAYEAIAKTERDNIDAVAAYMRRMHVEWQSVYFIGLSKHSGKQAIAFRSAAFNQWVLDNDHVL